MKDVGVVAAEADEPLLDEICALVESSSLLHLLAKASTLVALRRSARQAGADVLVVGSGMLEGSALLSSFAGVPVLVVVEDETFEEVARLLSWGVRGCIAYSSLAAELVEAVLSISAGRTFIGPEVVRRSSDELVELLRRYGHFVGDRHRERPRLSPRELEVLQLLAAGSTNRGIAQSLYISDQTVKNHVASIFRKLHVSSRTEAALEALRVGIVSVQCELPQPHADGK